MLKTRIKLRNQGFYDVRRLPKLVALEEDCAERWAAAANSMSGMDGYLTGSRQGAKKPQGRWHASIVTSTVETMRDNAKHDTIMKSMDAGRI